MSKPPSGLPQAPLPADHPDRPIINHVCDAIERLSGGWDGFLAQVPLKLREAIDEVIDTPRSGRFLLCQLEKTEKTYIGTKVEILIRDFLKAPRGLKGLLDLEVDGMAVDVKNTVRGVWMIPSEAYGHPCILLHEDDAKSVCSVGIVVAKADYLGKGKNKDGKKSLSKAGRANVHWILRNHPYPPNFWAEVAEPVRKHIMLPRGGTNRVVRLMVENMGKPVPMRVAEGIARQQDFRRRMRSGGGARDVLGKLGVVLLNGTFDADHFTMFGLPQSSGDEYVAIPVRSPEQLKALRENRHEYVCETFQAAEVAKLRWQAEATIDILLVSPPYLRS